jgi:DNA-binding IclR family transcriptional regulator
MFRHSARKFRIMEQEAETTTVQSVSRAAGVLRAIAEANRAGARLTDISRQLRLSKSTAHRLIATLIEMNLVERCEETGRFHLGIEAVTIGAAASIRGHLLDAARPALGRLAERSADTVYFTVRNGLEGVCLGREEGSFPIKTLSLDVGTRRPLSIGSGNLAMLAMLPDEDVERVLLLHGDRVQERWKLSGDDIRELVRLARRQGYAFVRDIFVPGMSAVGVALIGRDRAPIAALSITSIGPRLQDERRANIAAWLNEEARAIERKVGVSGPMDKAARS